MILVKYLFQILDRQDRRRVQLGARFVKLQTYKVLLKLDKRKVTQNAFDSRCQPFLARRGPVVHLADLRLREYARRGPVVHRATI